MVLSPSSSFPTSKVAGEQKINLKRVWLRTWRGRPIIILTRIRELILLPTQIRKISKPKVKSQIKIWV